MRTKLPDHNVSCIVSPINNTYVIRHGGSYAVVDPGIRRNYSGVINLIREQGGTPADVRLVIVTHNHPDHCASVDKLLRSCPNALLAASHVAADGFQDRIPWPSAQQLQILFWGVFPCWIRSGCPMIMNRYRSKVDLALHDGDTLPGDFSGWRAILSPGHSSDHLSIYNEDDKAFIAGDFVVNLPRPALNNLLTDRAAMAASVKKVKGLEIRNLYPGHGAHLLNRDINCLIRWE